MHWIKKGTIYKPDGGLSWSKTHAQVPVVDHLSNQGVLKVYFATRDQEGRSLT